MTTDTEYIDFSEAGNAVFARDETESDRIVRISRWRGLNDEQIAGQWQWEYVPYIHQARVSGYFTPVMSEDNRRCPAHEYLD